MRVRRDLVAVGKAQAHGERLCLARIALEDRDLGAWRKDGRRRTPLKISASRGGGRMRRARRAVAQWQWASPLSRRRSRKTVAMRILR